MFKNIRYKCEHYKNGEHRFGSMNWYITMIKNIKMEFGWIGRGKELCNHFGVYHVNIFFHIQGNK